MPHAVITFQGASVVVQLPTSGEEEGTTAEGTSGESHAEFSCEPNEAGLPVVDCAKPGPILPEMKELAWGAGSFVVFALAMRFFLYPKLKKGMDARYQGIRSAHESADAERSKARSEVAEYEAQLAAIKAEAARKVEAARNTVEAERADAIAKLNARLAEQRAAAAAQVEAARAAARGQIEAAVSEVAGRAGELATGKRPPADVVNRAVQEVMAK